MRQGTQISTTLSYDFAGRKIGMNDPDMGVWTYEYDVLGNLLKQTDAKGQVTTLSYDATVGRLLSRHNAAGTVNYVYSEPRSGYANRGRLTTVSTLKPDQQVLSVDALDYDALARSYYEAMGWDLETGKPSCERLERLGLDDVIKELYGAE